MNIPPPFRIAVLPTPLHRARRLEEALEADGLYIKRDDLTGFGFAGNKARKLEYLLAEALNRGADVLVAVGGPGSNLCQAAAVAANVAGLRCFLVLYGDRPPEPHANLLLAEASGANVFFTGDPHRDSVEAAADKLAAELSADGHVPYLIPRGGATPMGAVGYYRAVDETATQLADLGVTPEAVVVPVGSGGTLSGLLAGAAADGDRWRIVGASVSRPLSEITRKVFSLATECAALMQTRRPRPDAVEIRDARGPGYGIASEAGHKAARLAVDTAGLLLDQVYTAKSLGVVTELVSEGVRGPILWWHTGGTATVLQQLSGGGGL